MHIFIPYFFVVVVLICLHIVLVLYSVWYSCNYRRNTLIAINHIAGQSTIDTQTCMSLHTHSEEHTLYILGHKNTKNSLPLHSYAINKNKYVNVTLPTSPLSTDQLPTVSSCARTSNAQHHQFLHFISHYYKYEIKYIKHVGRQLMRWKQACLI